MPMTVYFLNHSGFAVDDGERAYIFDYNEDPEGHVNRLKEEGRILWFFVTHTHGDHFNPLIAMFNSPTTKYILHEAADLYQVEQERMVSMKVGDTTELDGVTITMYGSTDEGGSFYVDTKAHTFFHAGDLNWWHWLGDTDENNEEARQFFLREMERIQDLTAEIVFFPVDARLEEAREWGALSALRQIHATKLFVPMHYFGAPWRPSRYFKALYPNIPLWIPHDDGESIQID